MFGLTKVRDWYGRFERPISSLSLVGGFVFDAIFLKRADLFLENFWILLHLVVVGICIILINLREHELFEESDPAQLHFWLLNILQFFFGGLFSTFLVFYFRSATLAASWPFLLILLLAFIANEQLKKHYSRLSFQIGLLYLCVFSFLIFYVPVLIHKISAWVFVLSGVISLVVILGFIYILVKVTKERFYKHTFRVSLAVGIIFVGMNVLYFTNIIPPLPLSLKDSGIYHSLSRDSNGGYVVGEEVEGWSRYFKLYSDLHIVSGDTVYAFSAVFSPAAFNTGVVHEWQWLNSKTNDWVTESKVNLPVAGGRDGGYRTYSAQTALSEGHWRVNVLTSTGLVLGTLRFNVIYTNTEPVLVSESI